MSDLVNDLRRITINDVGQLPLTVVVRCQEAAGRIEQLEAEVARLQHTIPPGKLAVSHGGKYTAHVLRDDGSEIWPIMAVFHGSECNDMAEAFVQFVNSGRAALAGKEPT